MPRCALVFWLAAGFTSAQQVYTASIAPAAGEDFASPCRFELTLPDRNIRAVIGLFDYGPEVIALYNDSEMYRFASAHHVALLLARHCASRSAGDIPTDPAQGPARMLFAALEQFATQARVPGLAAAQVIPFGFAASAILAARLTAYAPDRVLAAVAYAPGDGNRGSLALLRLPADGAAIPQLVVANSADDQNGTRAAREYFAAHFAQGAPWMFAIQNGAPRRGAVLNIKPVLFAWMEPLLVPNARTAVRRLIPPALRGGVWLHAKLDARTRDTVRDARIERAAGKKRPGYVPFGWAATPQAASAWAAFVRARHPAAAAYR